ncbi:putative thiol oxidoreductase with 2 cytochrome c heme-binding site [Magnetofaba australis IT-1]|uniref:Putative thiol oxidoreductase with 2 cytochrome c heme-binding site n=2 Tax=Magnetofaba TaxID=1472292 RepID=A0A1Y2KBE5_9PROT|nr:putative thiol oxidoreductase with 2 cytochrome c heme-binding site [Magnetofaba australis IT-1]
MDFVIGNGFFKRLWVSAPSSTKAADGLGPLYNARACQRCHLLDGRSSAPHSGPEDWGRALAIDGESLLLRLSIAPRDDAERALLASGKQAVIPHPIYGGQLQTAAIVGHQAEAMARVTYTAQTVDLAGGESVTLRAPVYSIEAPAYGPLDQTAMISPRSAPPMIGLGLLEAIDEADWLGLADPDDADGDGISGRANRVWSAAHQRMMPGRFGWKAGQATVEDQAHAAMADDIGVSNALKPNPWGECTDLQKDCVTARHGDDPQYDHLEAPPAVMRTLVHYSRHLAVPARRNVVNPHVLAGKQAFHDAGCAACHAPTFVTRSDWPEKALRGQRIRPYSDLLLHDMGEGLADNRPEGVANGREWRTAPLWGVGLTQQVNPRAGFLHDGRARSLTEAILWHGGEAQAARERFRLATKEERGALLAFLQSL